MIQIQTSMDNKAAPYLARLVQRLGDRGRAALHESAAHHLSVKVRGHIMAASETRHKTADQIRNGPAKRTGHLAKAAESVAESFDSTAGTVSISSPGFRRAFGPLTIVPRIRRSLTIPVDALAYGSTVANLRSDGHTIFKPKGKDYLATTTPDGKLRVLYLLRRAVTLKHDPGLLPTADEQATAAKEGMAALVRRIVKGAQ